MKVLKSQIGGDLDGFSIAVAEHAKEMRAWREHMAMVKQDEESGVTGIERHMPHPRPAAHPIVEAAVNENSEPDYEFVDDGPTPEQVLRAQKDHLLNQVQLLEQAAIAAIVPPGKRRLFNIREGDIRKRDAVVVAETLKGDGSIIAKVGEAFGLLKPDPKKIADAVNAARSNDDQQHLADQKVRASRVADIERAAAEAHSDIEDLTAETIGEWQAPDFSKLT